MSSLEEAVSEKEKLYKRIKEVKTLIDTMPDGYERIRQTARLKILRDMYRDACDQVTRLQPVTCSKKKKVQKKVVHSSFGTWDLFERSGLVWSDLGGYTWNTIGRLYEETDAHGARLLMALVSRGKSVLTDRQRYYMDQCFHEHKSISQVASENGVNVSSVSRVLKSGLKRLENSVISSLYAFRCIEGDTFDHLRWASETEALTERQRELLYYLLSDDASFSIIADKLQLNKSTICRTNGRIVDRMTKAVPILPEMRPSRVVHRKEWRNRSEDDVAAMLGISKGVYYRNICRNRSIGGISRFAYECLRRRDRDAKDVAKELGCCPDTVRKYWRVYSNIDIEQIDEPEEYVPAEIERRDSIDLRNLLSCAANDGTIGASITADTYMKMLKVSEET